jgi:CRISPR-associated protein (TIGR03986 family)
MTRWPQHRTPKAKPGQPLATAPYNFVPLPEAIFLPRVTAVEIEHDRLHPDRLHGTIELELQTETPTYTRCAYPPRDEDLPVKTTPSRQDFYHHGDRSRPAIPGSSVRGMVRALVTILGYGKLTHLRDERLVHRAVADQLTATGRAYNDRFLGRRGKNIDFPGPDVRGGYLERQGGALGIRPATIRQGSSFVRVGLRDLERIGVSGKLSNTVVSVYVEPVPASDHPKGPFTLRYARTPRVERGPAAGLVPAALVISGTMPSRHMHTAIYEPDPRAAVIPIPRATWEQFEADREMHRGLACRKVENAGDPCFYLLDKGKLVFLGPTLFFRVPYQRSTVDFVPAGSTEGLDLCESLFGVVDPEPRRGRVSFDDALMEPVEGGGSPFLGGTNDGRRTPGILSAPKPTSFQSYLVQPEGTGDRRDLKGYSSSTPEETVLRGFKRYWHRGEPARVDLSPELPPEGDTQHTVIRPVRAGVTFRGRLRFENLTLLELGALLAALELPNGCRHQLGLGKPLGLGSVRLRSTVHLVDPRERYRSLDATGELPAAERDERLAAAREAFREAIVGHHNGHVETPKSPPAASFWELPRLDALRRMLTWEGRPRPQDTRYMDLDTFRQRPVLPTPAAVMGAQDPEVTAEVPLPNGQGAIPNPGAPRTPAAVPSAGSKSATPAPAVTRMGQITRFAQQKVYFLLDSESKLRWLTVNLELFPLDAWKKLDGNAFRPGRRVRVELLGEIVVRLLPAE